MLEFCEVRNFQSIEHLRLELGRLTVITGQNSSGKSAFFRAIQSLTSNNGVFKNHFITQGQKQTSVSLVSETHKVVLERGTKDAYHVIDLATGHDDEFTKLGGTVPEKVTRVLRIDPIVSGKSVNFAFQRDTGRPFLIADSTGSEVAKELGELTNVSVIFAAQDEANRHRKNTATLLKSRESDLSAAVARVSEFKGLGDNIKAMELAERLISEAEILESDVSRLNSLVQDVTIAESVLERASLPEVPDVSYVRDLQGRSVEFQGVVREFLIAKRSLSQAEIDLAQAVVEEADVKEELHDVLVSAGRCPTCGSTING